MICSCIFRGRARLAIGGACRKVIRAGDTSLSWNYHKQEEKDKALCSRYKNRAFIYRYLRTPPRFRPKLVICVPRFWPTLKKFFKNLFTLVYPKPSSVIPV